MKSVILLRLSAVISLCSPAIADNMSVVSVMSEVDQSSVAVPGCGGQTTGESFASTSFSCNLDGLNYLGNASGQTGLGPYGIGASMSADSDFNADRLTLDPDPYVTNSNVSLSWSQDYVIEGAQGSGFVTFDVVGNTSFGTGEGVNVSIDLFGFPFLSGGGSGTGGSGPLPVTFGAQYTISISGNLRCRGDALEIGDDGCGSVSFDVSDIAFFDASGDVLAGVTLEPVPEIGSWLLLATCAIPVVLWRRARSLRHGPMC
jgi:hypothetical protein